MNDDYLWDRSGEPDKEVQDLEEVLSTLRYQPRPLELPATTPKATRRSFAPGLAIAATIALLVLGATFWLLLHRAPLLAPAETVKQFTRKPGSQTGPQPLPGATGPSPPW